MAHKERIWLQILCRDGSDHHPNGRDIDANSEITERAKHLNRVGTLCGPHRVVRRTVSDTDVK